MKENNNFVIVVTWFKYIQFFFWSLDKIFFFVTKIILYRTIVCSQLKLVGLIEYMHVTYAHVTNEFHVQKNKNSNIVNCSKHTQMVWSVNFFFLFETVNFFFSISKATSFLQREVKYEQINKTEQNKKLIQTNRFNELKKITNSTLNYLFIYYYINNKKNFTTSNWLTWLATTFVFLFSKMSISTLYTEWM